MNKVTFWAISILITGPVILGLITDKLTPGIFAICWAYMWYAVFTKTARGRKMFRRGYKIAASIMQDM